MYNQAYENIFWNSFYAFHEKNYDAFNNAKNSIQVEIEKKKRKEKETINLSKSYL